MPPPSYRGGAAFTTRRRPQRARGGSPERRRAPASEPDADPACRLQREEGQRRRADTDRLFAALAEQRETAAGNEFVFRGDPDTLWEQVSAFVDEEAGCCPF